MYMFTPHFLSSFSYFNTYIEHLHLSTYECNFIFQTYIFKPQEARGKGWAPHITGQVDVVSLLYAEGKTTKYYIPKSIFSLIFKTFNYINFNFKRQGERFKDDNVFQTKNRKNKARGIGADKKPVSKQSKQIIAQSLPNSCLYTNITELQSWAHATIVA